MQVSPRPELDERYENLTPRQKAIVAARVHNPDATNRTIAHEIAPKIYNDEYRPDGEEPVEQLNESYTSQFQNKDEIEELIDYKQAIAHNQRDAGDMQTTGDPLSAAPGMDAEQAWQGIHNRPAQQTQPSEQSQHIHAPVRVEQQDESWIVEFDAEYFQHLLASQQLPLALHRKFVEAVMADETE